MDKYTFRIIDPRREIDAPRRNELLRRPFIALDTSFATDARRFAPGVSLEVAMNTAIAVGQPLLLTGEPGTGKTQAAYYAAFKLGIEPVIHFQVKSDTTAKDLLYYFDTVRYFHEANTRGSEGSIARLGKRSLPDKQKFVEKRPLWVAFESEFPRLLLIDEIDKAPRDFPNDLLHELDKMEFTIPETGKTVAATREMRPIVFITSNSERRLPEPFLRRCIYHHVRFEPRLIKEAIEKRQEMYQPLSDAFVDLALQRFLALRERALRKVPSTGEFLVWLRVLALTVGTYPEALDTDLSTLPYLGVLLKDHQDLNEVGRTR